MQGGPASSASGSYSSGLGRSDPVARADDVTAELLSLNGLQYCSKDTSLSLVTSRCHKKFTAVTPNALVPGATLQYRLDCGSQFLNPRTSYISFRLQVTAGNTNLQEVGKGNSLLNLFSTYKFNHSSGVEIEHLEDYNTWLNMQLRMSKNDMYLRSIAPLFYYQNAPNDVPEYGTQFLTSGPDVIIPLYLLSDMFRQNIMLPPWLLSGSLIQLTLAPFWQALISNQANPTATYTINQAEIVLDLYTLTDGTVRALSDLSASAGLDIDFTSMWQTNQWNQASNVTVSVQKALSQASAVHTFIRDEAVFDSTTAGTKDCFASDPNSAGNRLCGYYLTLGSLFMPQQPIETLKQLYLITQQCWNMSNDSPSNSIIYDNFIAEADASNTSPFVPAGTVTTITGTTTSPLQTYIDYTPTLNWLVKKATWAEPDAVPYQLFSYLLERSMILASSCAISSQRALQIILTPRVKTSPNRISVYTEYQKVVSVFLDSCIVRS